MSKAKRTSIEVQGTAIAIVTQGAADFISLTDIARYRNSQEPFAIINNWMRSRSTIEFLGLWEKLCNPDFKPLEFERFKNEAGSNPNGASHTSPGQRPGFTSAPTSASPEGATHSPRP